MSDVALREAAEPAPAPAETADLPKKKGWGIGFWLAVAWTIFIVVLCAGAPYLPFVDEPGAFAITNPSFSTPSADHWFGTNENGDDIFSQVANGGRTSLIIGVSVVIIGLLTGGVIGMIAGFFRGRTDRFISAVVDVMLAFPALVLALAMISIFASDGSVIRPNLTVVIGSLSILSIAPLARITRGITLAFAEREFVTAARTLGAKNGRIIRREILPNVIPPMAVFSLTVIAVVIVAEGALAYLGLSVSAPAPTWGKLILAGRDDLDSYPHVTFFPAGVMFLTILSLNYVGDVLQGRFTVREGAL
ncbi:ABC transporter permease [Actinospongicola halichondriae]|uniref:ABC transporter permease n=1 Tax=Actinospongicola halichondriae TaxID=3236844 RepID=UPI003D515F57